MIEPPELQPEPLAVLIATAEEEGLPVAVPKCRPWRRANHQAALCPSVYCERCQTIRERTGSDQLRPFTVPAGDLLHPIHDNERASHAS